MIENSHLASCKNINHLRMCYLRHAEKRPNDANDEVIIHRKSSYSMGYFVKSLNVLTHGASVIYLVELKWRF